MRLKFDDDTADERNEAELDLKHTQAQLEHLRLHEQHLQELLTKRLITKESFARELAETEHERKELETQSDTETKRPV